MLDKIREEKKAKRGKKKKTQKIQWIFTNTILHTRSLWKLGNVFKFTHNHRFTKSIHLRIHHKPYGTHTHTRTQAFLHRQSKTYSEECRF